MYITPDYVGPSQIDTLLFSVRRRYLNIGSCPVLPSSFLSLARTMGCCFSQPVDFDSEVNLFHFELHRAVGKGAFGKVGSYQKPPARHIDIVTGQGSRAQKDKGIICPQIHRQIEMCETKGRRKYNPRASFARGGTPTMPFCCSYSIMT